MTPNKKGPPARGPESEISVSGRTIRADDVERKLFESIAAHRLTIANDPELVALRTAALSANDTALRAYGVALRSRAAG